MKYFRNAFLVLIFIIFSASDATAQERGDSTDILQKLEQVLFPNNVGMKDSVYGYIYFHDEPMYFKARKNLPQVEEVEGILKSIRTKKLIAEKQRLLGLFYKNEDLLVEEFGKGSPMCGAHKNMLGIHSGIESTLLSLTIDSVFTTDEDKYLYCKKHFIEVAASVLKFNAPSNDGLYLFSKQFRNQPTLWTSNTEIYLVVP